MIESQLFRALADPTRRAIYERLSRRELNVSQLADGLPVSQPAISQHLSVLRDAGLLAERREGRFSFYRAEPSGLAPLIDWVEHYRHFWPDRVEELKTVLKEMEE
ncbi:MAG: ArsR/SmtB family transcription factor [Rhizobiaceae bacterium]